MKRMSCLLCLPFVLLSSPAFSESFTGSLFRDLFVEGAGGYLYEDSLHLPSFLLGACSSFYDENVEYYRLDPDGWVSMGLNVLDGLSRLSDYALRQRLSFSHEWYLLGQASHQRYDQEHGTLLEWREFRNEATTCFSAVSFAIDQDE